MTTVVLIEDEHNARVAIRKALGQQCPNIEVIGEADGVQSGIQVIRNCKPEIVLLDIQLKDGSGFELLRSFSPITFKLIFITAYESHAIKAFKFGALDYITKPLEYSELREAIDRAEKLISLEDVNVQLQEFVSAMKQSNPRKRITLKSSNKIEIVQVSDIIRCESDRNYTRFYIVDGRKIVVTKTLKEYDELLSDEGFFRSHHSHLINCAHLNSYEKIDGGYLVMSDKSEVPVATRKREQLLNLLKDLF